MKVCFKCRKAKSMAEFYKHPQMGDGHLGKCKDCTKKDTRQNRIDKTMYYREYDRARASMPHRVALRRRVTDEWVSRHPIRRNAQIQLNNALKAGKVKAWPCMICGAKAVAHHPDYSAPLDVVWLCQAHHKQAHAIAAMSEEDVTERELTKAQA